MITCRIAAVSDATTDRELVAAWGDGDNAAGSALFERYFDQLYRFFRNKVDEGVDDLIQQTMLACLKGLAGFRADATFRTWLFTIARHELYRHWRARQKRQTDVDVGAISVADMGTTPSAAFARRREHQMLLTALRTIPLDFQVALELYYWEGLAGPELAAVLEIPEGTARSRLRRGKEMLAAKMTELFAIAGETVSAEDLDAWAADVRAELAADGH